MIKHNSIKDRTPDPFKLLRLRSKKTKDPHIEENDEDIRFKEYLKRHSEHPTLKTDVILISHGSDSYLYEQCRFAKRAIDIETQLLPNSLAKQCIESYKKEIVNIEAEIAKRKHRDDCLKLANLEEKTVAQNCKTGVKNG